MARVHVNVVAHGRKLLGILSTQSEPSSSIAVYFHGFPDLSVHPNRELPPSYVSRFPRKLDEALEMDFLSVNFSGLPGSDENSSFISKTLSREIEDAKAIVNYCSQVLKKQFIHVIGLSTGAILAACLRDFKHPNLTSIALVAGIVNAKEGMHLDFTQEQINTMYQVGECQVAFFWPEEWSLSSDCRCDVAFESIRKVWRPLNRAYLDDMEVLDIANHVSTGSVPLLVIHGTSDKNVPIEHGQALYATAAEPKSWLEIKGANHLLSNAKHIKKAIAAIQTHIVNAEKLND
ncbi:serine protease family S09X [Thraustotheca clavata]|uniref:Serine protease family S09X n=1 Tax=Thraustotheca clavata TaxID=74557 RepID=A0A1W0A025_9STRA|nr:serine protease family S09X [Thraustotheca clavata]